MDCVGLQKPIITIMDHVTCTGTREFALTSNLIFPEKVHRIVDTVALVRGITYHIVGGKIIVQGTLQKQIFYENGSGVIRYQKEQLPFATFIEMDKIGLKPHIHIEGRVEHIYRSISGDGLRLMQKAIVSLQATRLEPRQVIMKEGHGCKYRLREVIATKDELITELRQTIFSEPVERIAAVDLEVKDLSSIITEDAIAIRGTLLRKLTVQSDGKQRNINEEIVFERRYHIQHVQPSMTCVFYYGREGKKVFCATPVLDKSGTVLDQEIGVFLSFMIWAHRDIQLEQNTGPLFQLEKCICSNMLNRSIEHSASLAERGCTISDIQYKSCDADVQIIINKLLIKGTLEYELIYISSDHHVKKSPIRVPFLCTMDMEGATTEHTADVRCIHLGVDWKVESDVRLIIQSYIQWHGVILEKVVVPLETIEMHCF